MLDAASRAYHGKIIDANSSENQLGLTRRKGMLGEETLPYKIERNEIEHQRHTEADKVSIDSQLGPAWERAGGKQLCGAGCNATLGADHG